MPKHAAPRTPEEVRLQKAHTREENWQRWGTYLPERQWGTVREDYSADGNVWASFPYDMAQYRAYRWGEDGILGWTDRQCRLCFSTTLWNGNDPHLKERLFGLGNTEGNHGEDVKEQFFYRDATPTHSFCKALYKYPQRAFPYDDLRAENKRRGFDDPEYEILDTGVFDDSRYFDIDVQYAKAAPEDTLIRLTVSNRGPDPADLHVLPTLTLRNSWSWHNPEETGDARPSIRQVDDRTLRADHKFLGSFLLSVLDGTDQLPERILVTENDSNMRRLDPNFQGDPGFSKDAFDRFLVHGEQAAIKPAPADGASLTGTKFAFLFKLHLDPGESRTLHLRLVRDDDTFRSGPLDRAAADQVFATRLAEADAFYKLHIPEQATTEECNVSRQAYAGLLWSKQFYYFVAAQWLSGDEAGPKPPPERAAKAGQWRHLFCRDVLSMPDKWEYPWFAAWDLAFHMITMAEIDPEFAKAQLLLLLREWYMHPNGQMPAYEFAFGDVNPPVHAWAVWHVYRLDVDENGKGDIEFLERAFQKLLLNFTWWVNRIDANGLNLFGGGFLGLDNIGVFDRSIKLPPGLALSQADGTAWMALFCSTMLGIAVELAHQRSCAYEDIASKFFEHLIAIINAINTANGHGLWDEEQGFYFDQISRFQGETQSLQVRSMVGLIPLFSVAILKRDTVEDLHDFVKRAKWFVEHETDLSHYVQISSSGNEEITGSRWISIAPDDRFRRILTRLFDQAEFLSPHGIRALSRAHLDHPFETSINDKTFTVKYVPAEGDSGMFGGNSNWRGPVWFPVNMLLINALERYYLVLGDDFKVEYPTGSGEQHTLVEIAEQLSRRLIDLFLPDSNGYRPSHGREHRFASDPYWKDLILFNEYFSGDDGRGVGATHQTGWTACVATLIQQLYTRRDLRNRAQ